MLKLSVHQFIAHLPHEQQGPVLVSKDAFLAFLRSEFRANDRSKRALTEAAVAYGRRENVLVDALADERQAAKAVIYAFMRLGDELTRRGKVTRPRSQFRACHRKPTAPTQRQCAPRFKVVETFVNGRKERIEQYPLDITWREARTFQADPLHELPDTDLELEHQESSATAHFEASSRPTGWGWLRLDGEVIERVRCWEYS